MSKLARWFGRLSLRSSTQIRLPKQHQKVTETYSFESVDYEEIGLPERWLTAEEPVTRVAKGQDTIRKSFWSRFTSSKLFSRSRNIDKPPKTSPSRSFSWIPGVARHNSPEKVILLEQLQEDQNQLTLWRLNESDLMKRRGYFCATNRPRICVCDCPEGTYSKLRAKQEEGDSSRMATPWDARWVFLGGDLKRLERESNERIERMLFY